MAATRGAKSSASLIILCRPEYVALGRLVAGSLGVRQGWDREAIADFKMVVSEVASFFLTLPAASPTEDEGKGGPAGATLRFDFEIAPNEWTLTLSNPDVGLRLPLDAFSDPAGERALGLSIVRALVDSVEHTDDEIEGTVFRLHKRLQPVETIED